LSQEREVKEKIHILGVTQNIKGGSERTTREGEIERSIFCSPPHNLVFTAKIQTNSMG